MIAKNLHAKASSHLFFISRGEARNSSIFEKWPLHNSRRVPHPHSLKIENGKV